MRIKSVEMQYYLRIEYVNVYVYLVYKDKLLRSRVNTLRRIFHFIVWSFFFFFYHKPAIIYKDNEKICIRFPSFVNNLILFGTFSKQHSPPPPQLFRYFIGKKPKLCNYFLTCYTTKTL